MEEALIKRILPHSAEAEQSVVGAMLMDREAVLSASEILTGDDFYLHQRFGQETIFICISIKLSSRQW